MTNEQQCIAILTGMAILAAAMFVWGGVIQ